MHGHEGVFEALVEAGADPRLPVSALHPDGSKTETTLAAIARRNDKRDMAEFIESLIVKLNEKMVDIRTGSPVTISAPLQLKKAPTPTTL
jgi:hypothetical protein